MTPYPITIKRWLLKAIPSLKNQKLWEHEALLTRSLQQSIEFEQNIFPKFVGKRLDDYKTKLFLNINTSIAKSNELINKDNLQVVKEFWMKQKLYAFSQRDFNQVLYRPAQIWKTSKTSAQFYIAYIQIMRIIMLKYANDKLTDVKECVKKILDSILKRKG